MFATEHTYDGLKTIFGFGFGSTVLAWLFMFKTLSRFTSSFSALLGNQTTELDEDMRVEDIRAAMVYQLSEAGSCVDCLTIGTAIARAEDVQALWYLRSNLVGVLAEHLGEEVARESVSSITIMFRGLVPKQYLVSSGDGPRNRSR